MVTIACDILFATYCACRLIESGLVSALSQEATQGESLAIAEDIKKAVLLLGTTTSDKKAGVDEVGSIKEHQPGRKRADSSGSYH
jgi:hypothetical protein